MSCVESSGWHTTCACHKAQVRLNKTELHITIMEVNELCNIVGDQYSL